MQAAFLHLLFGLQRQAVVGNLVEVLRRHEVILEVIVVRQFSHRALQPFLHAGPHLRTLVEVHHRLISALAEVHPVHREVGLLQQGDVRVADTAAVHEDVDLFKAVGVVKPIDVLFDAGTHRRDARLVESLNLENLRADARSDCRIVGTGAGQVHTDNTNRMFARMKFHGRPGHGRFYDVLRDKLAVGRVRELAPDTDADKVGVIAIEVDPGLDSGLIGNLGLAAVDLEARPLVSVLVENVVEGPGVSGRVAEDKEHRFTVREAAFCHLIDFVVDT